MIESTNLQPGDLVAGRYEVQQLIREGDRKRTYLGRDTKIGRPVALSVVRPEAIPLDPEGTEREAKVLGQIGSHDNIVSVYDYDVTSDTLQFTVFEYLPGGTLDELVRDEGPLPLEDLLRLGRQLCRGLAHLHGVGILHRDVDPKNILFDERRVAHLGDFDSAVGLDDASECRPVTTNSFAAPEELAGGPFDVRSDLYSLGGVLYVAAVGSGRVLNLERLRRRADLPTSFIDLVASLLTESLEDRPKNAEAVLAWLDDVRNASSIDALIAAGESQQVEFKASLHHAHDGLPRDMQKQIELGHMTQGQAERTVKKALQAEVTKTIAGLLNSEGGILLIGVDDGGRIIGIEADFPHLLKPDADTWLLSLQQVIVNDLGGHAFSAIRVSVVRHGDVSVAVVSCPRRSTETWHRQDGGEVFYIRTANGTRLLQGAALISYIRERWPA